MFSQTVLSGPLISVKSEFDFTIDRITGLDPAGPLFEETEAPVRIDPSDARFVDILHTNGGAENGGFLGMNAAFGHADFYPHGGRQQPQCGVNFNCSHGEAYRYYIDSVRTGGCGFSACTAQVSLKILYRVKSIMAQ